MVGRMSQFYGCLATDILDLDSLKFTLNYWIMQATLRDGGGGGCPLLAGGR